MQLVRITDAQPYEAPRHHGMSTLRLQGGEASPLRAFTVGLSQALPAGGADLSASPLDRVYIVLEGELFVQSGAENASLSRLDSCWIPAGEERLIANRTNTTVTFLVVMPTKEEH